MIGDQFLFDNDFIFRLKVRDKGGNERRRNAPLL